MEPDAPGQMLKRAGGITAHGNSRRAWDDGARFDYAGVDDHPA